MTSWIPTHHLCRTDDEPEAPSPPPWFPQCPHSVHPLGSLILYGLNVVSLSLCCPAGLLPGCRSYCNRFWLGSLVPEGGSDTQQLAGEAGGDVEKVELTDPQQLTLNALQQQVRMKQLRNIHCSL